MRGSGYSEFTPILRSRRDTAVVPIYVKVGVTRDRGPKRSFEPFLITMDDASEVFPSFEHPGTEFIYMLKGKIEYRHGQQTYTLEPGDALTLRGDVPHGPERLLDLPIYFLSIIVYGPGDEV